MEEMIDECTQMMNSMNSMMENGMMGMMDGGMMDGGMMGMMGMMIPWLILGLLLIIAVIVAIVWALRNPQRKRQLEDTPLTILKRRYAGGEIDAAQFEKMKVQISES